MSDAKPLTGVPCEYRHNPPDLSCSWCLHLEAEAAGPLRVRVRELETALREAKSFVESIKWDETQSERELGLKCDAALKTIDAALSQPTQPEKEEKP